MTTENLFSAVLTFSLMAGSAIGFGSDLLATRQAPSAAATLPTVTVIGQRTAAADRVTMPTVTVIGRRVTPTELAAGPAAIEQRVQ